MNRKGILIGVFAALMLFAFTACDNSPSGLNSTISYIEATSNEDQLVGEKVDPADYTFTGYTVKGNAVTTIPSNQFSAATTNYSATTDEVEFSWTYSGLSVTAPVEVFRVEKLAVNAENAEKTTYYTVTADGGTLPTSYFEEINKTGVVVTATYDGDKTKDVTASATFNIGKGKDSAFSSNEGWKTSAGTDYVVGVSLDGKTATYPITVLANAVKSISVEVKDGINFYYATASTDVNVADYAKFVDVLAEMTNGQVVSLIDNSTMNDSLALVIAEASETKPDFSKDTDSTVSSTLKVPAMAANVVIYAKYTGDDVVDEYMPTPVASRSVSVIKDSKVGIEVSETTAGTLPKYELDSHYVYIDDQTELEDTAPAGLTVKYLMASDVNLGRAASGTAVAYATAKDAEEGYSVANFFEAKKGYAAGMIQEITVQAIEDSTWTDTIDVTLVAHTANSKN